MSNSIQIPDAEITSIGRFNSLLGRLTRYYGDDNWISNTNYHRIIGMGTSALPYIFQDMQEHPERAEKWFWALNAITMHTPPSYKGVVNIPLVTGEWLEWAKLHHYI